MKKKLLTLSTLTLCTVALAACGTTKEAVKVDKESTTEQSTATEKKTFAIGDTVQFENEANITVTGVSYTDERNQFAEVDPLHVLVVTYNVDNLSDKDYAVGSEITLYVNGKKMDTYPITTIFDTISAGRSFEGATQAFAITEEGQYELEIKPSWSFTAKAVVIPFAVQ